MLRKDECCLSSIVRVGLQQVTLVELGNAGPLCMKETQKDAGASRKAMLHSDFHWQSHKGGVNHRTIIRNDGASDCSIILPLSRGFDFRAWSISR